MGNFTDKGSWAYNNKELINPHLVKLVDTSTTSVTKLCDNTHHLRDLFYTEMGYCPHEDPAGFFVVVYYDPQTNTFRFLSRAWQDYDINSQFHVFTTKGHLQLVSYKIDVYTHYLPSNLSSVTVKGATDEDMDII